MTQAERLRCEGLARGHRAATGFPIFMPQTLYDQMVAEGIDVSNVQVTAPIPLLRKRWG